jgi:hypothetical protein
MLMPSLVRARCEVEVMSLARLQSLQGGPAVLGIGEQVPLGCDIAVDGNRPIADAPVNPRARYLQLSGQFGDRQPPGEVARVCPTGSSQHAVALSNDLHRTHRDVAASGRAMAFAGQQVGDRRIGNPLSSQLYSGVRLIRRTSQPLPVPQPVPTSRTTL